MRHRGLNVGPPDDDDMSLSDMTPEEAADFCAPEALEDVFHPRSADICNND